jgi:putative hydrolase of the HAD superfamily
MKDFSHIDTWVFDLDGTLYDAVPHVFPTHETAISDYVEKLLGVPRVQAQAVRDGYYKKYGTTLRGLMTEHNIDPHHFMEATHRIDISPVPQCGVTRAKLPLLPGRKIIFTNAPRFWADRMLTQIGLDRHFGEIFSIEDAAFVPKPNPATYSAFLARFGVDPGKACMFEDLAVNLKPARDLGMTTVWIHRDNSEDHGHVQHKARTLADWFTQLEKPHA